MLKCLAKRHYKTEVQVVQDVMKGDHVNTALAKHSREAIGGLVRQARSGRKPTKSKVQFRLLLPFKNVLSVALP